MGQAKKIRKWFKYTLDELMRVYERIVSYSERAFKKGDYGKCLCGIEAAAWFQYNINDVYTDERLNGLLRRLADILCMPVQLELEPNTVCFIDSFARDNHGLTQQYLDAIIRLGHYRLVYISENKQIGADIREMLEQASARIEVADGRNEVDIIKRIYDVVIKEKPSMCFFHLSPNSVAPIVAMSNFKGIKKIQLNLTDHAFWLGGHDFFDYSFEFRSYGCRVSTEKRGFKKEQLVIMPFYPWAKEVPFAGFPVDESDKVVFFSGGALYKTEGGNDMYFKMLKAILDKHQNVVFFYAGNGDKTHFESFINVNKYEDRVFLIGQRDDINEVFKHSDIYYSTYPLFGGLMSQYAAINALPILAFDEVEIESVVCTKKQDHFVYKTEGELLKEADELIDNATYRQERGAYFQSLCMNQNDFRANLGAWMDRKTSPQYNVNSKTIDYKTFCEQYVYRINNGSQRLNVELSLLHRCPKALNCKMMMNLLLNIPEIVRTQIRRMKVEIN